MDVFKNFCGHFNVFIPFFRGILIQWQKIDSYFLQYVQKNLLFCSDFSTQFLYSFSGKRFLVHSLSEKIKFLLYFDSSFFKTSTKNIWLVSTTRQSWAWVEDDVDFCEHFFVNLNVGFSVISNSYFSMLRFFFSHTYILIFR